ncbi:ABC transporter ATP-binding protein [Petralouisia muris]|jgi:ATP-binding cassette subfamily B protein|uniref:ABC transporter ATP-binding protein n=1 Tax=Petralouisia muris TaxID=3032872 RepID=A0AC61S047_9FIRM|nr:ABC transporter ATP-binding protein [Petralouisia muris]TGY97695.1 ABC transporter ATP-binding protein [Petralouisia muris]
MGKIFQYLSRYKASVLVVILLLIMQAYCDLSLPQYMSDIVDIGIQQGGVAHAAPDEMRGETLDNLSMFLSQEDEAILKDAYEKNDAGNYERKKMKGEELEELDELLGMPWVVMSSMTAEMGMEPEDLRLMLENGQITTEQILEMEVKAQDNMGDMSDTLIAQRASLAVKEEYQALGWDLGEYQNRYMFRTGAKMLAMAVVMMAVSILVGLIAARVSARLGMELRGQVFQKVVSFSHREIEQFSTASLITRSTNDIQQIQMVAVILLRMVVYAPIIGIGGIFKVIHTKTGMGWIIGVAVGSIILLVGILMSVTMPRFKKMQTLVDRMNLVSREILTGVSVIRAFSREKFEEKRFEGANRDLMKTQLFTSRVMSMMMPAMMLIMNCITVLIVWFGSKGADLGTLQVGDMMAFITYTMQIVMAFLMITMVSVMLPRAGVAAKRIDEVITTEETILDPLQPVEEAPEGWKGTVAFEDVSFSYPGAKEHAVSHISFTAEPGKTTAIIGSTGCGKTTLLNLIPRFYDVTEGRITMDGVDIRKMSQKKLRDLIGYVPQKGMLFSGTIASNLQFAGNVTEEEMKEAARIAQAEDFILEKEEQYDSAIAQGGTNVSGGQKQRLSIARAIAKQPKVFLFDDSFSALDYKTDVVLRKALAEKTGDATVIIVAQRISTILHADQIIVLEDGQIAGMGAHKELMEHCEIYQEIAKSQLSEKELKETSAEKGGVFHE